MFEYYLFDLDGTLSDPGLGITNSIMYALDRFGIAIPERQELYKFIGPPLAESFMKYYGFSEKDAEEAVKTFRVYFREKGMFENELYAGVPELLEKLRARSRKLILATSKPEEFALMILEHFDILKFFDFVCGATMDSSRVRKADVIRYALESSGAADYGLGFDKTASVMPYANTASLEGAVMIGDREHDIIGAKTNNIASCGVTYGYGNRKELLEAGADFMADDPLELLDI